MGLSKWTASCFGFFEARYHAYVEIAWYFAMFTVFSLVQGIWAMSILDPTSIGELEGLDTYYTCNLIEEWLFISSIGMFVEAFLSLICALSVPSVMRSARWALTGLCGLSLYATFFLAKSVWAMLGVMWIFGENAKVCIDAVDTLFYASQKYMYAFGGVFLFQLVFGSAFVMFCGLADVWQEAMHNYDEASETRVKYVDPEAEREAREGAKVEHPDDGI